MFVVMYRGVHSDWFRKKYGVDKYIVAATSIQSDDKIFCIKYAREMNNHLKQFHPERYGRYVYYVREYKK